MEEEPIIGELIIVMFELPVVQISGEQKKGIKDLLSKITDQMTNDPRGLDGVITVGEMLLSENGTNALYRDVANMILKNILNDLEEPQRSKLLEKWELIRDSITSEPEDHNCCGDCEHCEHHNPEP